MNGDDREILERLGDELAASEAKRDAILEKLQEDKTAQEQANDAYQRTATIGLIAIAFAFLLAVGLGVNAWQTRTSIDQSRRNGRDTSATVHKLDVALARLNDLASIIDPSSPRGQVARLESARAANQRADDLVCRFRRAVARLPDIPAGQPCSAP